LIELTALPGLPEVRPGDDLAGLISAAGVELTATDVLVIAHKVISKAEGRIVRLADVTPSARARELAAEHGKDPRHVQVVLDEAAQLLRADAGRLICRTRHGFVCANAGVDASNAAEPDSLVLLPLDPDASARARDCDRDRRRGGRRCGPRPREGFARAGGAPSRPGAPYHAAGRSRRQRSGSRADRRLVHLTRTSVHFAVRANLAADAPNR
jgi:hypothetical protein